MPHHIGPQLHTGPMNLTVQYNISFISFPFHSTHSIPCHISKNKLLTWKLISQALIWQGHGMRVREMWEMSVRDVLKKNKGIEYKTMRKEGEIGDISVET